MNAQINGYDDVYRLAFGAIGGLSVADAERLLDFIGTEKDFFTYSESQLSEITCGRKTRIFERGYRDGLLLKASKELDFIREKRIRVHYFRDKGYPFRLLQIQHAPKQLFVAGEMDLDSPKVISVVGTRHSTAYGLAQIDTMISRFKELIPDAVILSGLAYGTDIAAHRAALKYGMKTACVVAHGLSTVYPSAHRYEVAEMLTHGGGMISELFSSAPIHKGNFPARNRIVAGLSDAVILVESPEKGGAIITANLATEYDRELFALPGRVSDPYSAGCNWLIANTQAQIFLSPDDFVESMGWKPAEQSEGAQRELFPQLEGDEKRIFDYLQKEGTVQYTRISSDLNLPIGRLTGYLMTMEFKGVVINLPGSRAMIR